jgi:membrane-associated phospholipid phosphatase
MEKAKTVLNLSELSVDGFNCVFTFFLLILTLANTSSVPDWQMHAFKLGVALIAYPVAAYVVQQISNELWHTSLHIALVVGLYSFLFQAIAPLQLIIHPEWQDMQIIAFETRIFGRELSLYLEAYTSPLLTEWMMFAYVIYVPLIPGIAFICYFSKGSHAAESYLLTLVISYAFCYIGFILFPVATQMIHMPEAYQVPLEGWLFTWMGEWIRETQHNPGGGLPSPHTAAGTVMLIYMYKYNRKIFYILLPVIITLYISTVYGRYHYTSDAVLGIIAAFVVYGFTRKYDRRILIIEDRYDPEHDAS